MSVSETPSETLADVLASQDALISEAAEALPHQFSHCTFPTGPLRQALYLCLTCPEARGICGACSIACHTDHEQIELFPKRNFRCDCPTAAIAHPCNLHSNTEPVNQSNCYGQNFEALFCRCKRPYDAATEKETMIQCLACEDWFHESCCNLRERPSSREPSPENKDHPESDNPDGDTASEAFSSLPPPLIGSEDYDAFVCRACVLKIPILQKYAGTPGCLMVVRDTPSSPWRVLQDGPFPSEDPVDDIASTSLASGSKRPLSPAAIDTSTVKRARLSPEATSVSSSCLAPTSSSIADKIMSDLKSANDSALSSGSGDIFLTDGFRTRWCKCSSCISDLEAHPYLLTEEETYEPPEDPDSGLSLEELGVRALSRLPRERTIDGIHAFNSMRDDLLKFLRPFAQAGKVVNEGDVRQFFDNLQEEKRSSKA